MKDIQGLPKKKPNKVFEGIQGEFSEEIHKFCPESDFFSQESLKKTLKMKNFLEKSIGF